MERPRRLAPAVPTLGAVVVILAAAGGCNALTGAGSLLVGTGGSGAPATTAHGVASNSSGAGHGGESTSTAATGGAGGDAGPDPCTGVSCSGHGTCTASAGGATCACVAGFHAAGLTCVADETCGSGTCGNCAMCQVTGGVAVCSCPPGYSLQGNACQLTTDPCTTTTCNAGYACVSEAHCMPLGACVETCDCGNCPNCGPGADWSTEQEYCGGGQSGPAIMACTKPCTGGGGCLPYSPGICWPLEGCFSM